MFLTNWRKWLDNLARVAGRRPRHGHRTVKPRRPYSPLLEPLEVRWVPSFSAITPHAIAATEGTAFTGTVAAFTTDTPGDNFTASIDWGDGTTDTGTAAGVTVTGSGGSYTVTGSHTYADEAAGLSATVTVVDTTDDTTATANDTATVADADTLTPEAVTSGTIPEGRLYGGTAAVFRDDGYPGNDPADFSASLDWGDGTTYSTDAGNVTVTSDGTGDFTLSVSGHAYADEGTYTVVATLADDSPGTATSTATGTLTVVDSDTLAAATSQPAVTATEGSSSGNVEVAVFTDTGYPDNSPADFSATIDWGDKTTPTTGTVSTAGDGDFTVNGSHTYAEDGHYTVTTTLADDPPGTDVGTATASADVAEADLAVTGDSVSGTEGSASTFTVATVSDPGSPDDGSAYTATIDWGDGTTDTGTAAGVTVTGNSGSYTVTGTHSYADEGSYTGTVTVVETGTTNGTASATFAATAADADTLAPALTQPSPATTEGQTFSGAVAVFTDVGYPGNTSADFSATINWGDGTTTGGTITGGSGSDLTVSGSHSYADEGTFATTVTLADDAPGTASATASNSITVADADTLTGTGAPVSATQFQAFNGPVATFSDTYTGDTSTDFLATISWGDGFTTSGAVSGGSGTFTVSGSHTYSRPGNFTITARLADDAPGTAAATATASAAVAYAAPSAVTAYPQQGLEGVPMTNVLVARFTRAGGMEPAGAFSVSVNWGDGTSSPGTVVEGSDGTYSVSASHTYQDEPPVGLVVPGVRLFPVTVTVSDPTSHASGQSFGVVIEPLPPGTADVGPLRPFGTANDRFIAELFNDLTGGRIDAATLNRYAASLRHHSRRSFVEALLNGGVPGFLRAQAVRAGGGTSRAALVQGYYLVLLDRPAGDLSAGLRKLSEGGEPALIAFLAASDEYFSKTILGG